MTRSIVLGCMAILLTVTACRRNTSITLRETDEVFSMHAEFGKAKTKSIQHYLNNQLGNANDISFNLAFMNTKLQLKDETTFYIRSIPGKLEIKMDKLENASAGYKKVRIVCEGIKDVLESD